MSDLGSEWPELLTPGEVAGMFRVDPKTVARWATEGRIRAVRTPGGHLRFFATDVREQLARRPESRRAKPAADTAEEL